MIYAQPGSDNAVVNFKSHADINLALDAAHSVRYQWAKTSVTERANILLKIADRIEAHLEELAVAETWDAGG